MGSIRLSRRHPDRWGAVFAVGYLRATGCLNLLGAVWASFGQSVRRHNLEDLYTPYLLTAGFTSGLAAIFLAVTMRRGKRAAWIVNLVLCGLFVTALGLGMAFPGIRDHRQNWVSLALSALFLAALLAGRRSFRARGDRANPRSPSASHWPARWCACWSAPYSSR